MKKTVNINLAGFPYVIDEDAYNMLGSYLNDIHTAFGNTEGGEEISADIESRAAELISETIGRNGKSIVDIGVVNEVIGRIGNAEELGGARDASQSPGQQGRSQSGGVATAVPPQYQCRTRRRLFRNPSDRMLGGVCSGLAQYFGIDTSWVRLAFIALTLISASTWVLVYLALWICVPEASTSAEFMEMKGECVTISGIGNYMRTEYINGQSSAVPNNRKTLLDRIFSIVATITKVLLLLLGILSIPVLLGISLGIVGCIVAVLVGAYGFLPIASCTIIDMSTIWGLLCALCWMLSVGIPILFFALWVLNSLGGANCHLSRTWRMILLIVWVIAIIGSPLLTAYLI